MPRTKKHRFNWRAAGHRMLLARLALGLSEKEAAEAYGVTLPTYRRYERGAPQRSAFPTIDFCDKFDVSINWLIGGDPDQLGHHLTKQIAGNVAILPVLTKKRRHFLKHVWPETLALIRERQEERERRESGYGQVIKFHARPKGGDEIGPINRAESSRHRS